MKGILSSIQDFFSTPELLPAGVYPYQTPPSADRQYRLHLRVEEDGSGLLIINAATVLHLNQTAAEYAYHIIQETPLEDVVNRVSTRYRIQPQQVKQDFKDFQDKIHTMIQEPDVDPVHFLNIDRKKPYQEIPPAPYRIDLALTYQLREGSNPDLAPRRRVDRELSTGEWQQILDKTWQAGVPHVTFTGGEPTIREDLIDLIQYAEENGQVTGLLSDGLSLLDADFRQEILLSGLDHLLFVLSPRQPSSWEALEAILAEDLYTTVHLTIHPDVVSEVPAWITRLSEMDANALSLSLSQTDNQNMQDALQESQTRAAELRLPLKWDLPVPYSAHNPVQLELEGEDSSRGGGRAWIYVEPDGDVLPEQGQEQVLGNLLREEWQAIWPPDASL